MTRPSEWIASIVRGDRATRHGAVRSLRVRFEVLDNIGDVPEFWLDVLWLGHVRGESGCEVWVN